MEAIWYNSYPNGVPHTIDPTSYSSLIEPIDQAIKRFASKTAFVNFGTGITYAEVDRQANIIAAYLQNNLGLVKGDKIAIMMPNVLQYPLLVIAALRAGLVVVNVNPLYTPRELVHQLNDAEVDVLFVLENFAATVEKALPDLTLRHIVTTQIADVFPWPKKYLMNFMVKRVKKMVPAYHLPHAIRWDSLMGEGSKSQFNPVQVTLDDLAFLQYTGGTTGVAKGAMLTHGNMLANLLQVRALLDCVITEDEVVITPLPLYHIFALLANFLTFFTYGGINVLVTNPRDIAALVKTLGQYRFSAMSGVNTLFNALNNHSKFKELDFSALKLALGGGMAVQAAVAEKWQSITGKPLIEGYGLTETSPVLCVNPVVNQRFTAAVGLPVPSTDVCIMDEEGNQLAIGETGELCVKGPQLMKGYWKREDETRKVIDEKGWFHTGDIARMDQNGFVYIVDRKKDMILVSGFNVYPNEIEDVAVKHPDILEAAAIGVPDPVCGEKVKLFVVLAEGAQLSTKAIRQHCRDFLTSYKVPSIVEVREGLPKNNVGKILRRSLRES